MNTLSFLYHLKLWG